MVSDIQLILVRPLSLDFVAKIQVIIFRASFYLEIGQPPWLQRVGFGPVCLVGPNKSWML